MRTRLLSCHKVVPGTIITLCHKRVRPSGVVLHHMSSLQVCALLPAEARPLLVAVGSTNPVKVEAVRQVRGAQDHATPLKQGARPRGSKRYLVLI